MTEAGIDDESVESTIVLGGAVLAESERVGVDDVKGVVLSKEVDVVLADSRAEKVDAEKLATRFDDVESVAEVWLFPLSEGKELGETVDRYPEDEANELSGTTWVVLAAEE